MTDKPTDAEIVALMRDGNNCNYNDECEHIDFARAVLAKWGTPATVGVEPVAWLSPWRADQVTTDYDAYGEHGIPLYTTTQPTQPQPVAREPLTDEQWQRITDLTGGRILTQAVKDEIERVIGIKGGQHGST